MAHLSQGTNYLIKWNYTYCNSKAWIKMHKKIENISTYNLFKFKKNYLSLNYIFKFFVGLKLFIGVHKNMFSYKKLI